MWDDSRGQSLQESRRALNDRVLARGREEQGIILDW
jgi:hypothetical protein